MNLLSLFKKIGVILLLGIVIWMGVSYKLKSDMISKLEGTVAGLQAKNIELKSNETLKIVIKEKEKKVYILKRVTGEVDPIVKVIEFNRGGDVVYTEYTEGNTSLTANKWILPNLLHVSGHISRRSSIALGYQILRYNKWGISLDAGIDDIALGIERDIYDYLPLLKNTYIGGFYSFLSKDSRIGLKIGAYL